MKKASAVNLDTLGLEMGNKPPQALEVEEAVLGAMLIEPSSVDMALEELSSSCFYDPNCVRRGTWRPWVDLWHLPACPTKWVRQPISSIMSRY